MISLVASPDQIIDEEIVYVILTMDDVINQQSYLGLYINLIVKKVGTNNNVPTYRLRYNGEPLTWEINKYTYGSPGTFQVSANIYDGPSFANTNFVVKDKFLARDGNIGAGVTSKVQIMSNANSNARFVNYSKIVEQNPNAQKVQQEGIDYFKNNNICPITTFTKECPSVNETKVQRPGKNVSPNLIN